MKLDVRKPKMKRDCSDPIQLILFNFDGHMLDRLLLQIRLAIKNKHSTGTDTSDMPRKSE